MRLKDEIKARIKTIRQEADAKIRELQAILDARPEYLNKELKDVRHELDDVANKIRPPT